VLSNEDGDEDDDDRLKVMADMKAFVKWSWLTSADIVGCTYE
jgi:hypothetical protein